MKETLWMVIDKHNKELPLCVGTVHDIAKFSGTTVPNIYKTVYHANKKGKPCKYIKVEV